MRAGPKQFILLNAAAPRAFVRQMESTVILSPSLRRAAMAAMAALAITWPAMLCARAQQPRESFSRTSPAGSYLAARHAGGQRDAAAAAAYYRAALRGDPRNNELLGRTFLAVLANGEIDEGVKLAERVLQVDKNDRIARLVLGVRAIKQKQYPAARKELAQSIRGPITDLAATLLSAWTMANPAEAKQATDSIDKLAGADWYAIFKELHSALILDLAGQRKEAAKHFERSYKLDPTALRVVQAYGGFLSRQGNTEDALKVFAGHSAVHEGATETAFGRLLADTAKPVGWTLIPKQALKAGGKTIYPDGTFRDTYNLPRRRAWQARRRRSRTHLPATLALSRALASARAAVAWRPL